MHHAFPSGSFFCQLNNFILPLHINFFKCNVPSAIILVSLASFSVWLSWAIGLGTYLRIFGCQFYCMGVCIGILVVITVFIHFIQVLLVIFFLCVCIDEQVWEKFSTPDNFQSTCDHLHACKHCVPSSCGVDNGMLGLYINLHFTQSLMLIRCLILWLQYCFLTRGVKSYFLFLLQLWHNWCYSVQPSACVSQNMHRHDFSTVT
jgi:hypothetical protein